MDEAKSNTLSLRNVATFGLFVLLATAALVTGCASSKNIEMRAQDIVGVWVGEPGVPLQVPPGPDVPAMLASRSQMEAIAQAFNAAQIIKEPLYGNVTRSVVLWLRDGKRFQFDTLDSERLVRAIIFEKGNYEKGTMLTLESSSLVHGLRSLVISLDASSQLAYPLVAAYTQPPRGGSFCIDFLPEREPALSFRDCGPVQQIGRFIGE